jgi:hypothetical protein
MSERMSLEDWIRILTVLGAVCSFLWGVYQWREKANSELQAKKEEALALADTRRIEATKPFLDRQLALYVETTKVVAKVATQGQSDEGRRARERFWELYWGELATVENREVEGAMVAMGDVLKDPAATATQLQVAAIRVAHACRESLDRSWGLHAWTSPDDASAGGPPTSTPRVPR